MNAAFYGVPQMRMRMFLVAYRRELAQHVTFPNPTHWVDLPPGYEGTRAVAMKLLDQKDLLSKAYDYVIPPGARPSLPSAVTADEALRDLPPIFARESWRADVCDVAPDVSTSRSRIRGRKRLRMVAKCARGPVLSASRLLLIT